jgi:hypothetical protein
VEWPNRGTLVNALMYELNSKVAGVKELSVSFMIVCFQMYTIGMTCEYPNYVFV